MVLGSYLIFSSIYIKPWKNFDRVALYIFGFIIAIIHYYIFFVLLSKNNKKAGAKSIKNKDI